MAEIQLPASADVMRAIDIWSSHDTRLSALLTRYGEPAPALRHYGLVLWSDGQIQSASQVLTGAAALRPEDPLVWRDLAGVFGALGCAEESLACVEVSLARDPLQPRIWSQLGSMQAARGNRPASVAAFQRALELDDNLAEAQLGLGIAYVEAKQFRDAIKPLQAAICNGHAENPAVRTLLGQALDGSGDFDAAITQFGHANRLQPGHRDTLMKLARAQFVTTAIRGTTEDALAGCERLALSAADIDKTISDAFHLLSAYEHQRAAIQVGELRLSRDPSDAMQAYLLGALKGDPVERAPDGYIVSFFDQFADEFEHKVVDILGYRVPEDLATLTNELAHRTGRTISHILDLGCGTGLAGARLMAPGRRLTGVDLSPRMLDKARNLGCYDVLVEAEAVAFLTAETARYDLVVSADMLIYFGDLAQIFSAVADVLEPDGLFALSIETSPDERDVVRLTSGRFAHGVAYAEHVARDAGFVSLAVRRMNIRLDAQGPAVGALILLAKASNEATRQRAGC